MSELIMASDSPDKFVFYHYNPSSAAAGIFVALFGLSTLGHAYQLFSKRTWYFIPFLIGGIFETIGYIGRMLSSKQTPGDWTLGPYIIQSLLILLAPALFAASIYMILSRIILLTDGEKHSIIRSRWLTKVFVTGDVLSFLVQSGGGGMLAQAKKKSDIDLGQNIITAGLVIQILFFGFFVVVSGIFHYRIALYPTTRSMSVEVPWQKYLLVLYAASVFIMIRSVFRVVEYVQGNDGYLLEHEAFLYVFDATLMFLTMLLFNILHPSRIIMKNRSMDEEYTQGPSHATHVGYEMPAFGNKR
ncbi:RTA1 like protein-domain-containing protein [Xylogone sp. PMI_703]|nr:RTA1 like protein-domain-containing protein [Xylogone sp. PMI_703]